MSVTTTYAEYASDLVYDDLPKDVVEYAKHLILDTVGLSIGSGPRAESTDAFLDTVDDLDSDGDGATILTSGQSASPAYAALANAAIVHSLDFDDTHRGGSLHPGAPVIGSALTAAEEVDASGEEFVVAVVAGYEIACRLAMAVNPASSYARGFHMTTTCGVFGGTAAAGKLYGNDSETIETAMGVNGSQAAGSLQFLENGGWNKRFHPGWAAHSAIVANALAENGFFAASKPIEGSRGFLQGYSDEPHPEKATAGLSETYELTDTAIKPYPVCRYMHGALDALFEIVEEHEIEPSNVESVSVEIPEAGYDLIGEPANTYPNSFVDAQFSMPFGAGLALTKQDGSVDTFLDAVTDGVDAEIGDIIDKTTVRTAEYIEEAFPEKWLTSVTVTVDGETYERTSTYPRGEPENPLSWEELTEKFDELVVPVVGEQAAGNARGIVADIESHTVQDLIDSLTEARQADPVPTDGN
jgi:2-methylcitrate dehydratase PrpD